MMVKTKNGEMLHRPEISIVVPAYNAEEFIEECLQSLARQTFTDFEAIVVDDGSTDRTAAISAAISECDGRFIVLRQQNRGVSASRNAGIEAARGRYLAFADADDVLMPFALEHLHRAITENDADMAVGRMRKGQDYDDGMTKPNATLRVTTMTGRECMRRTLYQTIDSVLSSMCGVLYRRELFDGERFREGIRFEDLDMFYRVMLKARYVALLDEAVYFYRQHNQSFLHTVDAHRLDALDVTDRLEAYIATHCPELAAAARSRRFAAYCNAYGWLCRMERGENRVMPRERLEREKLRCMDVIRRFRREEMTDRHARMKNRAGALLSYFPPLFRKMVSK